MSRKEYFAYGSNLNFEQMAYRCPEATAVGTAKLEGYELAFRRGYLTILPKEDASVEGLIWSVTDHDESQLDCYEGYPTFYDKESGRMPLRLPKHRTVRRFGWATPIITPTLLRPTAAARSSTPARASLLSPLAAAMQTRPTPQTPPALPTMKIPTPCMPTPTRCRMTVSSAIFC